MNKQKLLFINWNPEATPLKGRMMYATSRENFKQHVDLQGKDFSLFAKNDVEFN